MLLSFLLHSHVFTFFFVTCMIAEVQERHACYNSSHAVYAWLSGACMEEWHTQQKHLGYFYHTLGCPSCISVTKECYQIGFLKVH